MRSGGTNIIFAIAQQQLNMTVTEQLPTGSVETVDFQRLVTLSRTNAMESLVKEYGTVYVMSVTRDGCSGCAEQKPLFHELASKMREKHQRQIRFLNIHIRYARDDQKESWKAKSVFGHAAYPTYMVHVKSHQGPLEVYRAVYPTIEELEKQAIEALELAEHYKNEASK